jgi:hypothetical protein
MSIFLGLSAAAALFVALAPDDARSAADAARLIARNLRERSKEPEASPTKDACQGAGATSGDDPGADPAGAAPYRPRAAR